MRWLWLILLSCTGSLWAQTTVQKSVNSEQEYFIQILAEQCFKVEVYTSEDALLTVEAVMDGEYQDQLLIPIEQQGSTLRISTSFNPLFKHPNDKLSAHKVVAIALKVGLPKNQRVQLVGTTADVQARGDYRELDIQLSSGKCSLDMGSGTVEVKTQNGDIVLAHNRGTGLAESRFGQVLGSFDEVGDCRYSLQSVEGNIYLQNIKE